MAIPGFFSCAEFILVHDPGSAIPGLGILNCGFWCLLK